MHPEALRRWIRHDEADRGERDARPTTDMAEDTSSSVQDPNATPAPAQLAARP